MPLVVDTDVISFLYKRDTRASLYEPHLNDPPFISSFMSLAELRRWTLERKWGEKRRQELDEYLTRYLIASRLYSTYGPTVPKVRAAS
jgi:predicted nucleic acid-binding protein